MPRTYRRNTLDDYDITRDGEIINKHTGKRLKGRDNSKGYLRVVIGKKFYFIHRLVATVHIPNPYGLPQVNHKDGNKHNNVADNLEWTTNRRNREHAIKHGLQIMGEKCPWAKLTEKDVAFIRAHKEYTSVYLSKMFGVKPATIRTIRQYRSWKH